MLQAELWKIQVTWVASVLLGSLQLNFVVIPSGLPLPARIEAGYESSGHADDLLVGNSVAARDHPRIAEFCGLSVPKPVIPQIISIENQYLFGGLLRGNSLPFIGGEPRHRIGENLALITDRLTLLGPAENDVNLPVREYVRKEKAGAGMSENVTAITQRKTYFPSTFYVWRVSCFDDGGLGPRQLVMHESGLPFHFTELFIHDIPLSLRPLNIFPCEDGDYYSGKCAYKWSLGIYPVNGLEQRSTHFLERLRRIPGRLGIAIVAFLTVVGIGGMGGKWDGPRPLQIGFEILCTLIGLRSVCQGFSLIGFEVEPCPRRDKLLEMKHEYHEGPKAGENFERLALDRHPATLAEMAAKL
jgi:hypothetical protein